MSPTSTIMIVDVQRLVSLTIAACGLGLGFGPTAGAAELHVPADFPTIHEAVAAAGHGDLVVLAEGIHVMEGPLEVPVGLAIEGRGLQQTVLECHAGDSTCIFTNYEFEVELRDLAVVAQDPGSGYVLGGRPLVLRRTMVVGTPERLCVYYTRGRIENSVIAGCGNGLYIVGGGDGAYVAHNVLIDHGTAIRLHFNGPTSANPYLYNNVLMSSATAVHNHIGSPSNVFTTPMEGNLFFDNDTDASGFELDPALNVFGDPSFQGLGTPPDYLEFDLHLSDASPCVDAGRDLALGPDDDIDGDPRPLGTAPDCGIDEHEVVAVGTTGTTGGGGDTSVDDSTTDEALTSTTMGEPPGTGTTGGPGATSGGISSPEQGCGCRGGHPPLGRGAWAWLLVLLLLRRRRPGGQPRAHEA